MRKTINVNGSKVVFVLNSMDNKVQYKTTSQVKYWRLYITKCNEKYLVGPLSNILKYNEIKPEVKKYPRGTVFTAYPRKTAHRKPRFDLQFNYPSGIFDVIDQDNGVVAAEFDTKSLKFTFFDPEYKESISAIGRLLYKRNKLTKQRCLSEVARSIIDGGKMIHSED